MFQQDSQLHFSTWRYDMHGIVEVVGHPCRACLHVHLVHMRAHSAHIPCFVYGGHEDRKIAISTQKYLVAGKEHCIQSVLKSIGVYLGGLQVGVRAVITQELFHDHHTQVGAVKICKVGHRHWAGA